MAQRSPQRSFALPCSGERHIVVVQKNGTLRCPAHPSEDLERCLVEMGAEMPACLRLKNKLAQMHKEAGGHPKRLVHVGLVLQGSTAHITEDDNDKLEALFKDKDARVGSTDEGWLIWVDPNQYELHQYANQEGLSDSLMATLDFAWALGVDWLLVEAGGTIIDGLPINDW